MTNLPFPPLAIAALLALPVLATSQEPTKPKQDRKPTSRPAVQRPSTFRSGGYFGLYLEEQMHGKTRRVVLRDVFKGSDAERLGFKKGDVIHSVDGRRVKNGDQFIQLLYMTDDDLAVRMGRKKRNPNSAFDVAEWHTIKVDRDGKRVSLTVDLPKLDAHPKVGQIAPDFTAKSLDGKRDVRLSQRLGKKPLVLIFGSFT